MSPFDGEKTINIGHCEGVFLNKCAGVQISAAPPPSI